MTVMDREIVLDYCDEDDNSAGLAHQSELEYQEWSEEFEMNGDN